MTIEQAKAREKFNKLHREFVAKGYELAEAWAELQSMENEGGEVTNYPTYLPSFDEFVCDFGEVELEKPQERKA